MVSQRRILNLLTMLILLSLFAVACERPIGSTDDGTTDDQTVQTEDANAGGGVDGGSDVTTSETTDTTTTDQATTDTTVTDSTGETTADNSASDTTTSDGGDTATDADTTTQDDSSEAGGGVGDATQTTGDTTTTDESSSDDAATTNDAGTNTTTENNAITTTAALPATHTVAAGENLYRIGLKYGISWVAIANTNGLANPNILSVGQVLKLPGATTTDPGPTPSPQTETTYIVQAGDNLFRIGLKFGISWVQIAEANGLVNPNLISVGDALKIPVDTPGNAPQFSHVVKARETLFLISLQYGVAWPAIAEANNLTSPYIIYVGQTLVIPGSQ
jgi:LysM repeat protein